MPPHSHTLRFAMVLALAVAAAVPACSRTELRALDEVGRRGVVVNYSLVMRCGTLVVAGNPTTPGPVTHQAGPFLVYVINSIANEASGAEEFDFEASRLYVEPSTTSRASPARTGGSTTIPAGTTRTTPARVIMKIDPPTSPTNSLRYEQIAGNAPVVLIHRARTPENRDSCTREQLPNLPDLP